MKVRTAFAFDEEQRRTVRAAQGRGGQATRKECVTFIDRAIREALGKAPAPKPARKKLPPPTKPQPPSVCTCTDTTLCAHCRAKRAKAKRLYRTEPTPGMMTADVFDAFCADGGQS